MISTLIVIFFVAPLAYQIAQAIYNLYLHPLSHVPGPKSWIAFPVLRQIAACRGTVDHSIAKLHRECGDCVRVSANELSFISATAWQSIYGRGHLPKVWLEGAEGTHDIFTAEDSVAHARYRRVLSPAFSDRGLRTWEPTVSTYATKLIEYLKRHDGRFVDLERAFNMFTFDMIGLLSFGEDFSNLEEGELHPWVKMMFGGFRILPVMFAAQDYPMLVKMASWIMPKSMTRARDEFAKVVEDKVKQRLMRKGTSENVDFIEMMLRHDDTKKPFSFAELNSNANTLMFGGSETSATAVSSAVYWLLKTPSALTTASKEVRSAFDTAADITFTNIATRLPYLNACVLEALRIQPPGVAGISRYVPSGKTFIVDGVEIPPKTKINVHHFAAYHSPSNFHDADHYHPERFLAQPMAASGDDGKTDGDTSPFLNDNRAVFHPFSMGSRSCIAQNFALQEIRIALARLLWEFDLVALSPECKKWHVQRAFLVWEKGPLMVRIQSRFGRDT